MGLTEILRYGISNLDFPFNQPLKGVKMKKLFELVVLCTIAIALSACGSMPWGNQGVTVDPTVGGTRVHAQAPTQLVAVAQAPAKPAARVIAPKPASGGPDMFSDKETCLVALGAGNFSYYEPKFNGLKGKNPVDGKTKVVAPLESDACVKMLTVSGKRWVPQKKGTEFRFKSSEGHLASVPYARDSCGNPVEEIAYFQVRSEVDSPPVAYVPPPAPYQPPPQKVVAYETWIDLTPRQVAPPQMYVQQPAGGGIMSFLNGFTYAPYRRTTNTLVYQPSGGGVSTPTPTPVIPTIRINTR